jgi:ribosome-associated protein
VHTGPAQSARHLEAEAFHNLTSQTESRSAATPVTRPPSFATLRRRVLAALDELKAHDIREIDVRGRTSIADLLIIASGTSSRHVKSIADEVVKFAKRAGMLPLGVEGEDEAEWVLVDLGDIIVHVMLPRIREFYGLERLWTVGDQGTDAEAARAG